MSKKKVPEEVVLFPEIEIEGIVLKPWTFGILASISPQLEAIFTKLEEQNVMFDIGLSIETLLRMYFAIAPYLVGIITKTTGLPVEEVEAMDIKKATKLTRIIWEQNKESLKNVLTLFGGPMEENKPSPEESETS